MFAYVRRSSDPTGETIVKQIVTQTEEYFAAISSSIDIAQYGCSISQIALVWFELLKSGKGPESKKNLAFMIDQANEAKKLVDKTVLEFGDVRRGFLQVCFFYLRFMV